MNYMSTVSKLRQFNGKMGIMEQWAADNDIPTYSVNKKRGTITNNQTNEIMSFKREIPDYLHVVK